ncbi:mannosyltransferase [Colletotrichum karsti]|uniref:GPI mannosyltransferase 2 n=1 Tax=Colletotrichum karsti TaxID=1095194 RepID=A0A9P6LF72_9PEZI|nr:mannosyltransferase [Colletotrichum karsti]KAF9870886.1 mannosyltransferase [Colletotrichum karsti]
MLARHASHPRQTLITAFLAWKGLLLAIALGSAIAPSYDTSTTLMLRRNESDLSLVTRLTRWDAIYFTQSARRGYLFEQEWAFNAVLPSAASALARGARFLGFEDDGFGSLEAAFGIVMAHTAHLLAVLMLHHLTLRLFHRKSLAFLSALLHIISPAGLFLSAPYAESSFAFLTFTGYLILISASEKTRGSLPWSAAQISAGAVFGLATAVRSNGLLNGIPFAAECLIVLHNLLASPITVVGVKDSVAALLAPGVAGVLVAMGSVVPQYLAWLRYCSGASEARVWCGRTVPGVYSFVQDHYWGVGFLRYWTPGNIPLFALASPVLALLIVSGLDVLKRPSGLGRSPTAATAEKHGGKGARRDDGAMSTREIVVLSLAASQVLLAVLAITTYHVQIITRIASGNAVWYWWVAGCLLDDEKRGLGGKVVTFSVMYALIQGALFASFLPPA